MTPTTPGQMSPPHRGASDLGIEFVFDPPGFDPGGSDGLLAVVIYDRFVVRRGTHFYTDPSQAQQVACARHPKGKVVEPHVHLDRPRQVCKTQEVLFVKRGRVRLDVYNCTRVRVGSYNLGRGDVAVLLQGGHGLEVLEEVEMVECKTGPYLGKEQDKQTFTPGV